MHRNRVNVTVDPPLLIRNRRTRKLGGNSYSVVQAALDQLRSAIEAAHTPGMSGLDATGYELTAFLERLQNIGNRLWNALLEAPAGREARRAIRAHLDDCLEERRRKKEPERIEVELVADKEWQFPLEIVPLLNPVHSEHPAESLLAFRGIVRHTIRRGSGAHYSAEHRLWTQQRGVPLVYCHYEPDALDGKVQAYFESLAATNDRGRNGRIRLFGPYPSKDSGHSTSRTLASELLNPHPVVTSDRQLPAQIVHVHAHGTTGTGVYTNQTSLRLGYKRGWAEPAWWRDVSTADVDDAADQIESRAPEVGPLGFLNACAGGRGLQRGVDAFIDLLLAYGYRAVIGPVVDVPNGVAHEMARAFYDRLFSGMTVSSALYHAKAELLALNSPIGGLYALYGDPDLRVEVS